MASTTAEPPPFDDADYVLALQCEGTYLGLLASCDQNAGAGCWEVCSGG